MIFKNLKFMNINDDILILKKKNMLYIDKMKL